MTDSGITHGQRDERLAAVFRDKPELVIDLPEWMLPADRIDAFRRMDDLAVVEIAGRDSIAAAVRGVEEHGFGNLLPVYAYTGSEHGPWESIPQAVARLAERLPRVIVHPLLVIGSPGFWRAINGRFVGDMIRLFGHYTPCTGCHLYLHAVRIPLARNIGNVAVIAGERKSHSGSVKVNQVGPALDFYERFLDSFGIRLHLPVADVADGTQIENILEMPWERGKEQPGCCMSGNYRTAAGEMSVKTEGVMHFFTRFAAPAARKIVSAYLEDRVPDHEDFAAGVINDSDAKGQAQ